MTSNTNTKRLTPWVSKNAQSLFAAFAKRLWTPVAGQSHIARRVAAALALRPRGGIAHDALALKRVSVRLHVEWFARDIHLWDRDLPDRLKVELFARQCLEDVDAAIPRLFHRLPEVDAIDIAVIEPVSKLKVISGLVHRDSIVTPASLSLGMKLKTIGLNYRLNNLCLEPIP